MTDRTGKRGGELRSVYASFRGGRSHTAILCPAPLVVGRHWRLPLPSSYTDRADERVSRISPPSPDVGGGCHSAVGGDIPRDQRARYRDHDRRTCLASIDRPMGHGI